MNEDTVIYQDVTNEQDQKDNQDKEKILTEEIIVACGGAGILGLVKNGIKNFGSTRQYDLYTTRQGHGQAGEDIYVENHPGSNQAPLNYRKNEPDCFSKEGEPVQIKVYENTSKMVSELYENGEPRYADQNIAVPDDKYDETVRLLEKRNAPNRVEKIGANYDTIKNFPRRGLASFKYDCMKASKGKEALIIAGTTFLASETYHLYKEYKCAKKEERKMNLKKGFTKSLILSIVSYGSYVCGCGVKGQLNRPC